MDPESAVALCWAVKGGSGTSVYVAKQALASRRPVLIVDLDGDQPTVLGVEPHATGVFDWARSTAPASRLSALELEVTPHVSLLASGSHCGTHMMAAAHDRWAALARWLCSQPRTVLIDAGTKPSLHPALVEAARDRLLVTRPCYLALRDAVSNGDIRPNGVVLIREPGRALRARDVEAAIGVGVVAEVFVDPAVARAVDAGLLSGRPTPSPARPRLARLRAAVST